MPRTHATPSTPARLVASRHPAWDILEAQGVALEKIKVLAEFIVDGVGDGAKNVLADIILDVVEEAESSRSMALNTLRTGGA